MWFSLPSAATQTTHVCLQVVYLWARLIQLTKQIAYGKSKKQQEEVHYHITHGNHCNSASSGNNRKCHYWQKPWWVFLWSLLWHTLHDWVISWVHIRRDMRNSQYLFRGRSLPIVCSMGNMDSNKRFHTSKGIRPKHINGYRDCLWLSIYRCFFVVMPTLCYALEWRFWPVLSWTYTAGCRLSHNVQHR